jgi:hypothetical protein
MPTATAAGITRQADMPGIPGVAPRVAVKAQ